MQLNGNLQPTIGLELSIKAFNDILNSSKPQKRHMRKMKSITKKQNLKLIGENIEQNNSLLSGVTAET